MKQNQNQIKLNYKYSLSSYIGKENGFTEPELEKLSALCYQFLPDFVKSLQDKEFGFSQLPFQSQETLKEIKNLAEYAAGFENFILIGMGGSVLGNMALQEALTDSLWNIAETGLRKNRPRMFFCDNVEGSYLKSLMNSLNPKKTILNVITKSGSTAETMANFMVLRKWLKDAIGASYVDHIVAITDPVKGDLRCLVNREGFKSLAIPQNIGGRYSVLSCSGLFSAAVAGIEIEQLLAGARYAFDLSCNPDLKKNISFFLGALGYAKQAFKNKNILVIMPYSSKLSRVAEWFLQLRSESLGKKKVVEGQEIYTGSTSVKAIGATDQHSQIQLYMEGPADKFILFLVVEKNPEDVLINDVYKDISSCNYLEGQSLQHLLNTEQLATEIALAKIGRPSLKIILPQINSFVIGQLLFILETAIVFASKLYKVNPFDQPGVEMGKINTYALMNRPGYEKIKKEILAEISDDQSYLI